MATVTIHHAKVSGKAAGTDSTRVYGTHWDEAHTVTGLENVDNTSDANKPISTATQAALDLKQPLDADLTAIAGVTSAADKVPYFTGSGTASVADYNAQGRAITALGTTAGIVTITGAGTAAVRTLTGPAAGITVSNGSGASGNPTLALANDLSALEGLASTGIARRTGTDTWSVGTAVANSELATMAAYTLKGNATGSSATPTDVDIAALTTKATPGASDYVIISDQAASGAWKKATVSSVSTSAGVSSIAGNTGAFTLSGLVTNSTNDIRVLAAAKTDQQTGSSTTLAVTPSQQQSHDSAAKAWVIFTGSTGAILASYNVSSVTRSSAGIYVINFTTAFATANYACNVSQEVSTFANTAFINITNGTRATGSVGVTSVNFAGNANNDPATVSVACFGRQ